MGMGTDLCCRHTIISSFCSLWGGERKKERGLKEEIRKSGWSFPFVVVLFRFRFLLLSLSKSQKERIGERQNDVGFESVGGVYASLGFWRREDESGSSDPSWAVFSVKIKKRKWNSTAGPIY